MIRKDTPLSTIRELSVNTMVEHIGIEITELGDDYIVGTMPVDHRTVQTMGVLHGGATMALIETLGSIGSTLAINNETHAIVGLEINANHLKMAKSGLVTCKAVLIHEGRKTHIWQADVWNENNERICTGRLTTLVIEKRS